MLKDGKFFIPMQNTILDTTGRTEETKEITPPKKKKRRKELTGYQALQKNRKGKRQDGKGGKKVVTETD